MHVAKQRRQNEGIVAWRAARRIITRSIAKNSRKSEERAMRWRWQTGKIGSGIGELAQNAVASGSISSI